jgi:hypothetical protein
VFSAFRSKPVKEPTPAVEVVSYDGETLELQSATPLKVGMQEVILLHEELQLEHTCKISVDQAFPEKNLYWASFPVESNDGSLLATLIPQEQVAEEDAAPQWEEKRSKPRLSRVLGIMSPQVKGFKTVTHDVHSAGLRLQVDEAIPVGPIKLRLDLDDARLEPIDIQGEVVWCHDNGAKKFWAGVRFTQIPPKAVEIIDKFIAEVNAYESGVLTRDYAAD